MVLLAWGFSLVKLRFVKYISLCVMVCFRIPFYEIGNIKVDQAFVLNVLNHDVSVVN